ncbi:MAG TPA: hypothetical protein VLB76_17305 [Thermoanaerobaculia bacterium]|jgi:hypothetical protein|nr:hypothetical protein [Thermoanaerobaculia bacterium]
MISIHPFPRPGDHAFEPDPLSFGILSRRAARRANLEINQTAAGDRTGTITLFTNRSNRADNRVHPSLGSETAEENLPRAPARRRIDPRGLLEDPRRARLRALGLRRFRKNLSDRGYGGVYSRV